MRPLGVVFLDPSLDDPSRLRERAKAVEPDALLLERPHEPFNHTVLFRGVRSDVFGFKAILAYQLHVPLRGEDGLVVSAKEHPTSLRFVQLKAPDQGVFQRCFSYPAVLSLTHPVADDFPVPAVNDRDHMTLPGILAEKMRHVRGPSLIGQCTYGPPSLNHRAEPLRANLHAPTVSPHDALYLFLVYHQPLLPSKHHRDPPVAVAGIALNQLIDGALDLLIHYGRPLPSRLVLNRRPGDA
jgi:hypothetical protein